MTTLSCLTVPVVLTVDMPDIKSDGAHALARGDLESEEKNDAVKTAHLHNIIIWVSVKR